MAAFLAVSNRGRLASPEGRSLWERDWGFQRGWEAGTQVVERGLASEGQAAGETYCVAWLC